MKCIHYYKTPMSNIVRVTDEIAQEAVDKKKAYFISKSEWKRHIRDISPP
jgi:hypothetical protein